MTKPCGETDVNGYTTVQRCPCCGRPVDRPNVDMLASLRLSPQQRVILDYMAKHLGQWLTTEQLVEFVWNNARDGGPITANQCLSVQIMHLRRRLKGSGFEIEGHAGLRDRRLVWADAAAEALAA